MQILCLFLIHPAALGSFGGKKVILLIFSLLLLFDEGGQRERERPIVNVTNHKRISKADLLGPGPLSWTSLLSVNDSWHIPGRGC